MSFIEDFQNSLESLPIVLQKKYGLMRDLDRSLHESQSQNEQRCEQEIEDMERRVKSGNITPDTPLIKFSDEALEEQKHCIRIADEKVALALQAYDVVDEHIQQLDQYLRKFDEEQRRERDVADASRTAVVNPDTSVNSGDTGTGKGRRKKTRSAAAAAAAAEVVVPAETPSMDLDLPVDPNEPTYCFCNQVSFGEMVACDNPDCKIEWFHFSCVGLREHPRGKWYCSDCAGLQKRRKGK
ncbi:PHD finger protein ING1-like [Papaver somniferum]|uniref:PHD finger protein ING1-like n=1 Tax=Papaver somniferum TaxID=3469 RepID=UPI000E700A6D|nr:PHD finger protein ING1-like [Papaver somniferum]